MSRSRWTWPVAAVAVVVILVAWVPPAGAVPSFARRYGTSCQTCHVVFPKLTPFGEAFRRNAYHFPDGQDEDYRRKEPQKMGADGYKDVFPWAVWPGEIPADLPISAIAAGQVVGNPSETTRDKKVVLAGSASVNVNATFGEWLAVWVGATARGTTAGTLELGFDRAFFVVSPGRGPWGNVRLGMIEPGVLSFTTHRSIGPNPWVLTAAVGNNQFALEPAQFGAEWSGVGLDGRGTFTLGVVDGAGNQVGPPTDVYGRIASKWGGMRLDGVEGDGQVRLADPAPWREWSVLVGAFVYSGRATVGTEGTAWQTDRFTLAGADVNAQLRDANVIAAYTYTRNSRPFLLDPSLGTDTHNVMLQVDYVVFPWLVPSLRAERRVVNGASQDRVATSLYVLLRANVRTQLLAVVERAPDNTVTFNRLQAGLTVGF
ncbi:MAG: hypothetical protein HY904_03930 [Deltaproteobacteria bacterium]|nr:hypothetical protein [Deltaproteobacteria bacterium]